MKELLQKFIGIFNQMKTIHRLMFMYLIGGFIPLIIVSGLFSVNIQNILLERALDEADSNSRRIENRIQETLQVAADISDAIFIDEELKNIIKTKYTNNMSVITDLNNYTNMDRYLNTYSEISSIRIYVDNQTLLNDSQIIKAEEYHKNSEWYKRAVEEDGKKSFVYRYDEIAREEYLSVVRLVKDNKGSALGVLVVNISNEYLNKVIESQSYEVLLIFEEEVIVLATNTNLQGARLSEQQEFREIIALPPGGNDYQIAKMKYKVFCNEFEGEGFKLLTLIPLKDLNELAYNSAFTSGLIIIISASLSVLMFYIQSKFFSNRINIFRENMHRVAQGDFDIEDRLEGDDEFVELSNDLNSMAKSIQVLIHEVYEVELQKEQLSNKQREVEFKMLASQINPHFLYNSLETIRMKAYLNGEQEIAIVVKKLAKIMRRNLSISNDEVSLKSELEFIRNYLDIQKFRFGDKFKFDLEMQCNIEKYIILPLVLQPLVENAFVHGIENKIGTGNILIKLTEGNRFVHISVEDDGEGIEEQKLKYLMKKLEQGQSNIDGSIGLTNVNQRIKIYYGDEAELKITSKINKGTKVYLKLPLNIGG